MKRVADAMASRIESWTHGVRTRIIKSRFSQCGVDVYIAPLVRI
ncbi:MAG: hypothetical protein JWM57_520, partial [Phycisphaerales bacterium]|nr:hypothetical protein [Phycisphaerales bacterium]